MFQKLIQGLDMSEGLTNLQRYNVVSQIAQLELGHAKAKKFAALNAIKRPSRLSDEKKDSLFNYFSENMQRVLTCVSKLNKELIIQLFLIPNEDKKWWEALCSKTTFYKRRKEMVDEFIFYYFSNYDN
ncbi:MULTISPECIES: MG284/MPN403 family protein [unclassified Mycoplasma]|uniref:MG284/MPN403 family protein n=1 Tax=unclassified Mycoplasma TaxID=2683645 RepID=UPI00216B47A3|nr:MULTISPECIES: hypothetical protein [unclassified Mycoplasma]MCS4536968.1 hypothetical protein [Mycoplasma sp. CSL7475-4]MCT4469498.1 hypothetical protein [Mycoplasma sp. HS2188]